MFHDIKSVSLSPSKGKLKEETQWRTGWWDFYSLTEKPQRPLEWSQSSVIITAHPTQPTLVARHFSSSKQFTIPSPPPILASPMAYLPPTVISLAPGDEWLFAYFPKVDHDGMACIWKRGTHVDSWSVKECWNYPRGAGVVTAAWLGSPREWVPGPSAPIRLPPRGPKAPSSAFTLLLVTQNHQINVFYLRYYMPSIRMLKTSLTQPSIIMEQQQPMPEHPPNPQKQCVSAAIGLAYNEPSIIIALRSRRYPPTPLESQQPDAIGSLQNENSDKPANDSTNLDYDTYGEDSTIELCEVQFRFDGVLNGLAAQPLPPLQQPHCLTSLHFVAMPAQTVHEPERASPRKTPGDRGKLYLAATLLDFNDFSASPVSHLVLHSFSRQIMTSGTAPNSPAKLIWSIRQEATRVYKNEVLGFVCSSPALITRGPSIYVGLLHMSGRLPPKRSAIKETPIGALQVVKLPDLTDSSEWSAAPLVASIATIGHELPLKCIISPDGVLAATLSTSTLSTHASIHPLPQPLGDETTISPNSVLSLSSAFAAAILGRRSPADVVRVLSKPAYPISDLVEVLYHVVVSTSNARDGSPSVLSEILGAFIDLYRTRALRSEKDREVMTARWESAHDMCSLLAFNVVFDDCKDGDTYDLDAVWQLIALATWALSFTEKLLKQCVLSYDLADAPPLSGVSGGGDDLFGSPIQQTPPDPFALLEVPILLHLSHPVATRTLASVLTHVHHFRTYVGGFNPPGETPYIAKNVLVDLVDHSGMDILAIAAMLNEASHDAVTDLESMQRAIAICQPVPAMFPSLTKTIQRLVKSSAFDKPTLFIKPFDLVDGILSLSVMDPSDDDDDDREHQHQHQHQQQQREKEREREQRMRHHRNQQQKVKVKGQERDVVTRAVLREVNGTSGQQQQQSQQQQQQQAQAQAQSQQPQQQQQQQQLQTTGALGGTGSRGNGVFECVRCGGRSQVGINVDPLVSPRWRNWERTWFSRCLCGGAWIGK